MISSFFKKKKKNNKKQKNIKSKEPAKSVVVVGLISSLSFSPAESYVTPALTLPLFPA